MAKNPKTPSAASQGQTKGEQDPLKRIAHLEELLAEARLEVSRAQKPKMPANLKPLALAALTAAEHPRHMRHLAASDMDRWLLLHQAVVALAAACGVSPEA